MGVWIWKNNFNFKKMFMNEKRKMIFVTAAVSIIASLITGVLVYLYQVNKVPTKTAETNEFAGVVKYNCEKSGGYFSVNTCVCPIDDESWQTQEMMYDRNTGYCQSIQGGPAGDAFFASIGLPYGEYAFLMEWLVNKCLSSGGEMSGAACICSDGMNYDKLTGYCK